MRYLRVTAAVENDGGTLFDLLANTAYVRVARAQEWNLTNPDEPTFLYAIEGDPDRFREEAQALAGVERVDISVEGDGSFHALVQARPAAVDCVTRGIAHGGLVVRKPIVYRDGEITGRVIGDPEPLQAAMDGGPDGVRVDVEEVGSYPGSLDQPTAALSDRQREALETAFALGYYESPRRATHEDIAAELECAPATASSHLQKAESKLVGAVLDEFGPAV
ncbi:helix-turn-helix domain-containing protein [Halorhabdus salina]|uniref:helix-turn-helix domain-containing protein n=1 Tax=Halorhabdus salina TaxID=2750670 RepID=UPI0015EEC2AF|nr:helix-turn-helix domain-containing protein [Halorhabdus salina]